MSFALLEEREEEFLHFYGHFLSVLHSILSQHSFNSITTSSNRSNHDDVSCYHNIHEIITSLLCNPYCIKILTASLTKWSSQGEKPTLWWFAVFCEHACMYLHGTRWRENRHHQQTSSFQENSCCLQISQMQLECKLLWWWWYTHHYTAFYYLLKSFHCQIGAQVIILWYLPTF